MAFLEARCPRRPEQLIKMTVGQLRRRLRHGVAAAPDKRGQPVPRRASRLARCAYADWTVNLSPQRRAGLSVGEAFSPSRGQFVTTARRHAAYYP
jgi:hypothetical protein